MIANGFERLEHLSGDNLTGAGIGFFDHVRACHQIIKITTDGFVTVISEHFFGGWIPVYHMVAVVQRDNGIRRMIENRLQELLAPLHFEFGLPAFGNILRHADNPEDVAVGIANGKPPVHDPTNGAVGP